MMWIIVFSIMGLSKPSGAKTFNEAAPISASNLKGHETLYRDGWLIISSSKEAFETAIKENSTAKLALNKALEKAGERNLQFREKLNQSKAKAETTNSDLKKSSRKNQEEILNRFEKIADATRAYSNNKFAEAYAKFVLAYISLRERTNEDWQELKKKNSEFFQNIQSDLTDQDMQLIVGEALKEAEKLTEQRLWSKSFRRAGKEMHDGYEQSGKEKNSVQGLGELFSGYAKAIYYGIFKPTGQETANLAIKSGIYLVGGVIGSVKIVGRIVYSLGINIYYSSSIGYHLISPTIEGGLLGSMALASAAAIPVIKIGEATFGTLTEVAIAGSPAVGAGQYLLLGAEETAQHSALLVYDVGKAAGTAMVHETRAGLVLGYNALTAIPSQLLLGAVNGAVFLVYEGPKLSLAYARGEIDGVPMDGALAGTVMDVKKLEAQNIKVHIFSEDPTLINDVIKQSEKDLRK